MKDKDALPISTPTASSSSFNTCTLSKKETSSIVGRARYKFWAFAAILLFAFWSMLTGTVTLHWSAVDLTAISQEIDIPLPQDLDVLEIEERENLVKHMWDVYRNSRGIKLPKFWQEAFEAAYEELTNDIPGVPEDAISEIAKMSVRHIAIESLPLRSSHRDLTFRHVRLVIWGCVTR
ncbi:unnamed protein product [Withania somnifera]